MSFLEVGRVVGRFEILEVLGEGGMAVVYKVRHRTLHSIHALKVLDPALARDGALRQRFLNEGRIQAGLRHPNIVAVTDVVVEEGIAGLIAEYVDGIDLQEWIEMKGGTRNIHTIQAVFLPLLDALQTARDEGVIHRDVKPSNIVVVTRPGGALDPKLLDFGIAKVLSAGPSKHATRTGARLGTVSYMSPEQIDGSADLDARTDIFAIAATLHEFVRGESPFGGGSEFATMKQIVEGKAAALPRDVDAAVRECVRRGLERDREQRFQSCKDFSSVLVCAGSERRGGEQDEGVTTTRFGRGLGVADQRAAATLLLAVAAVLVAVIVDADCRFHADSTVPTGTELPSRQSDHGPDPLNRQDPGTPDSPPPSESAEGEGQPVPSDPAETEPTATESPHLVTAATSPPPSQAPAGEEDLPAPRGEVAEALPDIAGGSRTEGPPIDERRVWHVLERSWRAPGVPLGPADTEPTAAESPPVIAAATSPPPSQALAGGEDLPKLRRGGTDVFAETAPTPAGQSGWARSAEEIEAERAVSSRADRPDAPGCQ